MVCFGNDKRLRETYLQFYQMMTAVLMLAADLCYHIYDLQILIRCYQYVLFCSDFFVLLVDLAASTCSQMSCWYSQMSCQYPLKAAVEAPFQTTFSRPFSRPFLGLEVNYVHDQIKAEKKVVLKPEKQNSENLFF